MLPLIKMISYQALEEEDEAATCTLPSVVLASAGSPAPGTGTPSTSTSTPSPLSVHSIQTAANQLSNSVTTYYNSLPPAQQQHMQYAGYGIGGVLLLIIVGLIAGIIACKSQKPQGMPVTAVPATSTS